MCAAVLLRGLVAVAFPALIMPLVAVRGILVFNRRKGAKDVEVLLSHGLLALMMASGGGRFDHDNGLGLVDMTSCVWG